MTDTQDTPTDEGLQTVNGSRAEIVDTATAIDEKDTPASTDSGEESRKYAGRYDSVEDLEKGYKSLTAEYTRSQQALAAQQAATSQAPDSTQQTTGLDPDIQAQIEPYVREATAPLEAQLAEQQQTAFWDGMRKEYGEDIGDKVSEYFETLPAADKAQLDTLAGARMIAKLVGKKRDRKPSAAQSVGGAKSHNAPASSLSRAQIDAMSPDEYARRQPEIMRFYQQQ